MTSHRTSTCVLATHPDAKPSGLVAAQIAVHAVSAVQRRTNTSERRIRRDGQGSVAFVEHRGEALEHVPDAGV